MSRIRLSGVFLAIFCLLSGNGLFAGEVALVTSVKGIVQAELASESWDVEIAEMLPDGVEIKVSPDGSLVLVHLATNREYRFDADAHAVVSLSGVTGEKFASSSIELVSSDVDLGQDMGNQTGAVNPERVSGSMLRGSVRPGAAPAPAPVSTLAPPPPPLEAKPALDSSDKGLNSDDDISVAPQASSDEYDSVPSDSSNKLEELALQEMKNRAESEMQKEMAMRDKAAISQSGAAMSMKSKTQTETVEGSQEQSSGISGFVADAETDVAGPQVPSITLAMPAEIFARICTDETSFKVAGDKIADKALDYPIEKWVSIKLFYGTEGYGKSVILNGNVGSMSVEIADPVPATIIAAWKLEKSGRLYQAAALWLELLQAGMPVKNVTPHLNRIKAKILELK